MKLRIYLIITSFLLILSCASNKIDPATEKDTATVEIDAFKRARNAADKGGGIFGDINNRKSGSTKVDFASSNVMWRATLKTLEFLPLSNTDYSGGIIVYVDSTNEMPMYDYLEVAPAAAACTKNAWPLWMGVVLVYTVPATELVTKE